MNFAEFPALKALNATQLENLRNACDEQQIEAGEVLISRGHQGGAIYFLLEGGLQVYVPETGREVVLVELQAPAIVGELELLTGQPRTASVRAMSPARVLAISHETIQTRIDDGDPAVLKVVYAISRLIAGRLVSMTEKFVEIEMSAPPQRSDELRSFRTKLFSEWSFEKLN